MKLKNIATLIFRIIGGWTIFTSIQDAGVALLDKQSGMAIGEVIVGFMVGLFIVFLSKKLAGLFCRGLDDDAA